MSHIIESISIMTADSSRMDLEIFHSDKKPSGNVFLGKLVSTLAREINLGNSKVKKNNKEVIYAYNLDHITIM